MSSSLDRARTRFVARLPLTLRLPARDLLRRLGIVPDAQAPWSALVQVAPGCDLPARLFGASTDPQVQSALTHAADAHVLAELAARGREALTAGRLAFERTTVALVDALHQARDAAFARLRADLPVERDYRWAAQQAGRVEREESRLFAGHQAAGWVTYWSISAARSSHVVPAIEVLARRAGWSAAAVRQVGQMAIQVAVADRMRIDGLHWTESFARGTSWVVALMNEAQPQSGVAAREAMAREARRSGILLELFTRAGAAYEDAAYTARSIGLTLFAERCAERGARCRDRARGVSTSPGLARPSAAPARFLPPQPVLRRELSRPPRWVRPPVEHRRRRVGC